MDFSESWNNTCSKVGYAVRLGKVSLLNRCIRERKPVDVADNRGWRPLHEAAAVSPTIECLDKLLKHGKLNHSKFLFFICGLLLL